MLDFEHIETMEAMANILKEQWNTENFLGSQRLNLIQTYSQVCTAIAQAYMHYETTVDLDQPFVRVGNHIVRKKDIVRIEIVEGDPKILRICTRDIEGKYEG